ncbi:MAG: hypothetical protein E2O68_08295 [Deltaproteobacteria bacterium]|nr:MAG: hypothetical protein E2O68_08295 [Deltaproteobacteria bacterium]
MNITDKITLNPEIKRRPTKKNLSKQEIRDMVSANKKSNGPKGVEGEKHPRDPPSPKNIEALKGALQDGTISFSPQERAILEKLLTP